MTTFNLTDFKLIRINKASVTILYKEDFIFIVKKNYNKLLSETEIQGQIIEKHDIHGQAHKWLAILSIF